MFSMYTITQQCHTQLMMYTCTCKLHTHLKSFPSNFLALVKTTVLAGMLSPRAKVSVANSALMRPSEKSISIVSLRIGNSPE